MDIRSVSTNSSHLSYKVSGVLRPVIFLFPLSSLAPNITASFPYDSKVVFFVILIQQAHKRIKILMFEIIDSFPLIFVFGNCYVGNGAVNGRWLY